ncbi:MAG: segregation/condensation protein A [Myxococcales bacterium]|nr:segregation/condensation protein A [Polyangiaceae bacterium]MDW8251766.1 segregation/condensation protein A [Myxococcales bacterium]
MASPQVRPLRSHVKQGASEPFSVEATLDPLAYNVALPQVEFEGPLDLLLHLIQSHQLNIFDIPVHFITARYLEYLAVMQSLSMDIASEYLVMAAVLAHIKSKMLLPVLPSDTKEDVHEEEIDPRQELVRRLLEYQRFKAAAAEMASLGEVAQDAFPRPPLPPPARSEGPLAAFPLHLLVDSLVALMGRRKIKINHEVTFERLTITDRINQLSDLLRIRRRTTFEELFDGAATKFDMVLTFLALLEMSKLRLTRIYQAGVYAPIHIEYALEDASPEEVELSHEPLREE